MLRRDPRDKPPAPLDPSPNTEQAEAESVAPEQAGLLSKIRNLFAKPEQPHLIMVGDDMMSSEAAKLVTERNATYLGCEILTFVVEREAGVERHVLYNPRTHGRAESRTTYRQLREYVEIPAGIGKGRLPNDDDAPAYPGIFRIVAMGKPECIGRTASANLLRRLHSSPIMPGPRAEANIAAALQDKAAAAVA